MSSDLKTFDQLYKKKLELITNLKTELDMKQIELKVLFNIEMKKKIARIKLDYKKAQDNIKEKDKAQDNIKEKDKAQDNIKEKDKAQDNIKEKDKEKFVSSVTIN
jgi:hypothetical protein